MSKTGFKRRQPFKASVLPHSTPITSFSTLSTCLLQVLPSTHLQTEFNPGSYEPENLPILTTNGSSKPKLIFPTPAPPPQPSQQQYSIIKEYMSSPRLISVYINSPLTSGEEETVLTENTDESGYSPFSQRRSSFVQRSNMQRSYKM